MIKILIADDHPIVRRGLRELVSDENDMQVVSEASNAGEIILSLRNHDIDVVLLDISMPGKSGLDLIVDIKNEFPERKILILSGMAEELFAKRAIKCGAYGYLNKEAAPEQLVHAIRKVYTGKMYISDKLAESMASDLANKGIIISHEKLSDREFEVMRLIGNGRSTSQIAELLNLSVSTISTYRSRILEKLNLKNNAEIIHYCLKENLLNK
jgi:DNA-binding NarL/FixJ family response regulator